MKEKQRILMRISFAKKVKFFLAIDGSRNVGSSVASAQDQILFQLTYSKRVQGLSFIWQR